MDQYTEEILRNTKKINELKERVDETVKYKDKSEEKKEEWKKACSEFREQYARLSFPGGFEGAYQRILDGEPEAMEAAICFLECRPYFFRSGYMFRDILRKAKKAPLTPEQKMRLEKVIEITDK